MSRSQSQTIKELLEKVRLLEDRLRLVEARPIPGIYQPVYPMPTYPAPVTTPWVPGQATIWNTCSEQRVSSLADAVMS